MTWVDDASMARMQSDIEKLRAEVDVLVVSYHWGVSSSTDVVDYQRVVDHMQDVMIRACRRDRFDLAESRTLVDGMLKRFEDGGGSLLNMARYERYDAFTFGHSIRVCFIALNFARHLTNDMRLVERIGLAALMHDVGKAWVPFEVLHSNERLTDAERAEMNMHPVHGGQILLGNANADPLAVAVAFSHHRNMDGSGYPTAIHPRTLSTPTMIVKLADVFEALTATRPYKPRMSPTRAYRIMMDMDDHFEPSLLRRFIEVNGFYPVGSRVRLGAVTTDLELEGGGPRSLGVEAFCRRCKKCAASCACAGSASECSPATWASSS